MVPAATTTPSANGAPHHAATLGVASDDSAHDGRTTASAMPTAPSSGCTPDLPSLANDDAKAIRNFADFKQRHAAPTGKLQRGFGIDDGDNSKNNDDDEYDFDDDDTCIGIVYQVYEDLRRIRKWRNVTVVWSDILGRHYICGTAPAMFDSVFPERRRQTDGSNQNGDVNANDNDSETNGNRDESSVNDSAAGDIDYTQIVIPIGAFENVSPIQLQMFCTQVRRPAPRGPVGNADGNGGPTKTAAATQRKRIEAKEGEEDSRQARCITLAVVDDDSTAAYYRVFSSFDEIVHPQWKRMKKHHDDDGFTGGGGTGAGAPPTRGGTNENGAGTLQQQQEQEAYEDGLDDSDSD